MPVVRTVPSPACLARHPLSLALLAMLSPSVAAQSLPAAGTVAELDRIVVTATRTERAREDVPSVVTVIDEARIRRELARDLRDLFRYEPGVTVTSSFGRFGLGDIRIRGLGGNRVRIETDGIAVPDAFAIGSFSNANRNFVDVDTLKRAEVLRGPASALYGSDALGGVVAFVTKDPADVLAPGRDAHLGFKLGVHAENHGLFASTTTAWGGERWSGLLVAGHRQGRQVRNQGTRATLDSTRTAANPQRSDGRSLLGKLVFEPDARQRFRLTVDANEDQVDTDVLTSRGNALTFPGAPQVRVDSLLGDDHQTRARLSLAHEVDATAAGGWLAPLADALHWQVYRQDSETTQRTREHRTTLMGGAAVGQTLRARGFNFDQRLHGIEATLHKGFATGAVDHALTYGFEVTRTDTRQKRDGRATDLATGAVTPVIPPDVFPVRDFPVSRTDVAALFVQDEMAFAGGTVRVIPAVRIDRYELEPQADAIFIEDNPGVAVATLHETAVSPKLGAVWKLTRAWTLFGGVQRGFRAPPYNDVNLGFTNLQFGYTAIPNPDLRPETSEGAELGVRFAGSAVQLELSAYLNRYDDFIQSQAFVGFDGRGLMVFQSRNVDEAEIRGVELRGGIDLAAVSPALDGWSLRTAAAVSRGEDTATGAPLGGIDPSRATLGLAYRATHWGLELAGRFAARRDRLPEPDLFVAPGHGVVDLLGHWAFAPGVELNAGVFNLADKTYWDSGDLPATLADGGGTLERFTAPGRHVGMSLAVAW